MNRKQRRRKQSLARSASKRERVREAVQGTQPKMKVHAMDLFRAQDASTKAVLRSHTMTKDGYENAISRLGLNQDNALSAGTYQFDMVTRNRILLEMAYRGSWIVGQVVDCIAQDMTREGVDVTTSEAEEKLPDFKASFTRHQVFSSLCEGLQWGRLYGGAIGVIDIDGQNLSTPLNLDSVGKGQFRGIQIYDRWMLNPVLDPVIPFGPDAGLPVFYQIVSSLEAGSPSAGAGSQDMYVHHSRCFRFGGIKLPFFQAITEQMWDESVLERLWDRLISFDNATLSTASLIDRANLRTVGIEGLREVIAAGGEALEGLQGQFEMMRLAQVNEGLTLIDKNDDFASTSYSFAGIPDTLIQFAQQLAGASQIPLVRLFGQSPAGLNSTGDGDIRLYYDGIKAKQEKTLRNPFSKLIRVMWRSEFGTPPPKDLDFTFTPLWQTDAKDKAEIGSKNAETIGSQYDRGLISASSALKELRGQAPQTGLFGSITDKDIADAEAEPPPMPDVAPEPGNEPGNETEEKPEGVREPVRETGDAGNFKEGDHPRAKNGEFTAGGGGGGSSGGGEGGGKKEKKEKQSGGKEPTPAEQEYKVLKEKQDILTGHLKELEKKTKSQLQSIYGDDWLTHMNSIKDRINELNYDLEDANAEIVRESEKKEKKKSSYGSGSDPIFTAIESAGQKLEIDGMKKLGGQDGETGLHKIQIGSQKYQIPIRYVHFTDPSEKYVYRNYERGTSEWRSEEAKQKLNARIESWMKSHKMEGVEHSFAMQEKGIFSVVFKPKRSEYEQYKVAKWTEDRWKWPWQRKS